MLIQTCLINSAWTRWKCWLFRGKNKILKWWIAVVNTPNANILNLNSLTFSFKYREKLVLVVFEMFLVVRSALFRNNNCMCRTLRMTGRGVAFSGAVPSCSEAVESLYKLKVFIGLLSWSARFLHKENSFYCLKSCNFRISNWCLRASC